MKIYKYYCDPDPKPFQLEMPKDAKILSIQEQEGHICMWAQFDSEYPKEGRTFFTAPTGLTFDIQPKSFIGTVQLGWTVWHIYELN